MPTRRRTGRRRGGNLNQRYGWKAAAHWKELTRAGWNVAAQQCIGATALPEYGPLVPTEQELQLLGDLRGLRVLEIGCGSGHSLLCLAQHGAGELWDLDLAATQIALATSLLQTHHIDAHLFTSPMELNPGIPESYFDLIVSIYAADRWNGTTVVKYPRKLSTFVNAVLGAGLRIERLLEPAATSSQDKSDQPDPAA